MSKPDDRASTLASRKDDHIALCADGDTVAFRGKTTLFEEVELVHDALPDLRVADVDLTTDFAGKRLRAPLVIAAMTGGTPQADTINRDLARVAEAHGIGFAFGSQRPLLVRGVTHGYHVRDVAPTALVLGNIGVVQARDTSTRRLQEMLNTSGADALCVHLNPAMEVVQPEGDSDFSAGLDTLRRLLGELDRPLIVKETGCGLSRRVGERLARIGVTHVDVSGAGGTSWVGVEARRAQAGQAALGELYWDWGIPTAASVAQLSDLGFTICATGGVQHGLDAARALALGARVAGVARPFLQAQARGYEALDATVRGVIDAIRVAHLLTGSANGDALRQAPLVLGTRVLRWVPRGSSLRGRLVDA